MKILFLINKFPFPVNSGRRMRAWHYIRGLARVGEVCLVCGGEERKDDCASIDRTWHNGKTVRLIYSGYNFDRKITMSARLKALFSLLPCAVWARVSPGMKDTARQAALETAYEALVCDGIHMALNVPLDLPCRKILNEHNVESTIVGRYFNVAKNPLVKAYVLVEWFKFRRFEERMWRQFDEIHVCSQADKIQVEKRCGHPCVRIVPNGVSLNEQDGTAVSKPAGARRLVYSGLMGWQPNNDAALYFAREIYPRIREKDSKAEWFIVGRDPSAEVKALSQNDPSVTVTGFVEDVKPLVRSADVFVVPLRIGSGTRLKILEAMAMGKAVVSTSVGCEGLDVTHGRDILISDDPEDFAACVLRLLKDEALRAGIARAGRVLVERMYDWQKIEEDLGGMLQ